MIAKHDDTEGSKVEGVYRYPAKGIKVAIVGGGIGGLQAALECWRKGCEVVVLEKATELSPIGDFIATLPSGMVTMREYPGLHTDYHETVYDCTMSVFTPSGKKVNSHFPEWRNASHPARDVQVSFLTRRPAYSRMQREELQRLGVPIRYGQKVVAVEETPDGITLETASGERLEVDICVAASGIGSNFGRDLIQGTADVQDSGFAAARVAFPMSIIDPASPAAELLKNVKAQPEFRAYMASGMHLVLMLTKDWVAWVLTQKGDGNASESWHNLRDADEFIARLQSSAKWDPAVISFLKQTPSQVVDWKLVWRDGVEKWTSDGGRLVRLGDSAHSFLPTSGNGANQALEDAISLAECLRVGGKAEAAWATKVHNKLRFQRTSVLQQMGFTNAEQLHSADLEAIEANSRLTKSENFFKSGRWMWGHDPEKYARENYHACLAHVRDGAPFENTNLPPGHVYRPWTLQSEKARAAAGIKSDLKTNGDWSA